jgi:glutathione S-transferase
MQYTLISSERSPFGRVCRMLMHVHKIDFEFKILNFVGDEKAAQELSTKTPINKVPVLIDGGKAVYDSRVIVNHLSKKHGLPALSLDEENFVSAIYSVMDTSIILFLLKHDGFDMNHKGSFLKRNRERIPANLNFVSNWASELDPKNARDWNYVSMSLYACLRWGEARAETFKIKDFPQLEEFFKKFADAPGVRETDF